MPIRRGFHGSTAVVLQQSGLDFRAYTNDAANSDIRLNWSGANLLPRTAQTGFMDAFYVQQTGYYACVWNCHNDGTFHQDTYEVGFHPHPCTDGSVLGNGQRANAGGSTGTTHYFEIAGLGAQDYIATPGGSSLLVTKGVWLRQIWIVEAVGGNYRHTFYPDALGALGNADFSIVQEIATGTLTSSSTPVFLLGCSPWTSSNFASTGTGTTNNETPGCIMRNIGLFDTALSISDARTEAASTGVTAASSGGSGHIWYINRNPTPSDITDKSAAGHTPSWANGNRPDLWTSP